MAWHSSLESAEGVTKSPKTEEKRMNLQPLGDRLIVEVLDEE